MSTLEAAIVYSVVLVFICFLIVAPVNLVLDSNEEQKSGIEELAYFTLDEDVIGTIDSVTCTSPERFCTMLTGLSDSFQIVFGGLEDLTGD